MRAMLVIVGVLAATACAHPEPLRVEDPAETERVTARAEEQRAQRLEQALSELSAGAEPPACTRVCDLVRQICDLSAHICLISNRHPGDPELAGRCVSGEQRCRRARERVPPGCSCPGPH